LLRFILPLPVTVNLLAAELLVLIFGTFSPCRLLKKTHMLRCDVLQVRLRSSISRASPLGGLFEQPGNRFFYQP
jgi:hypothetical protein